MRIRSNLVSSLGSKCSCLLDNCSTTSVWWDCSGLCISNGALWLANLTVYVCFSAPDWSVWLIPGLWLVSLTNTGLWLVYPQMLVWLLFDTILHHRPTRCQTHLSQLSSSSGRVPQTVSPALVLPDARVHTSGFVDVGACAVTASLWPASKQIVRELKTWRNSLKKSVQNTWSIKYLFFHRLATVLELFQLLNLKFC